MQHFALSGNDALRFPDAPDEEAVNKQLHGTGAAAEIPLTPCSPSLLRTHGHPLARTPILPSAMWRYQPFKDLHLSVFVGCSLPLIPIGYLLAASLLPWVRRVAGRWCRRTGCKHLSSALLLSGAQQSSSSSSKELEQKKRKSKKIPICINLPKRAAGA